MDDLWIRALASLNRLNDFLKQTETLPYIAVVRIGSVEDDAIQRLSVRDIFHHVELERIAGFRLVHNRDDSFVIEQFNSLDLVSETLASLGGVHSIQSFESIMATFCIILTCHKLYYALTTLPERSASSFPRDVIWDFHAVLSVTGRPNKRYTER